MISFSSNSILVEGGKSEVPKRLARIIHTRMHAQRRMHKRRMHWCFSVRSCLRKFSSSVVVWFISTHLSWRSSSFRAHNNTPWHLDKSCTQNIYQIFQQFPAAYMYHPSTPLVFLKNPNVSSRRQLWRPFSPILSHTMESGWGTKSPASVGN